MTKRTIRMEVTLEESIGSSVMDFRFDGESVGGLHFSVPSGATGDLAIRDRRDMIAKMFLTALIDCKAEERTS
jgi:hypothetical protein